VSVHPPIRPYADRDRAELVACVAELQDFDRSLYPELLEGARMASAYADSLLAEARDRRGGLFVYEAESRLLGFVNVAIRTGVDLLESTINECAYVTDLMAREAHRGRGIGTALLEAAERYARERGLKPIRINAGARNEGALRAYRRYGFADHIVVLRKSIS